MRIPLNRVTPSFQNHFYQLLLGEVLAVGVFVDLVGDGVGDNRSIDVIRAVSYINSDWDAEEMWDGWGQTRIETAPLVAFDTETTSLDPMAAKLVGMSFSVAPGEAAYLPLAHRGTDVPAQLPLNEVLDKLRPWLESDAHAKVGQNLKYDAHVLANNGERFREPYLTNDIETHRIRGVEVRVYSIAKTIADAFRNPKLVDRSVAIEAMKAALSARKATAGQLAAAARENGAWNQMRPYLEALTSNG